MNCAENPFNMSMFLQLEVPFKMGAFSDTQHTHPGIFILELPPPPPGKQHRNKPVWEENVDNHNLLVEEKRSHQWLYLTPFGGVS